MLSVDSQVSRASQNAQSIISKIASRNGESKPLVSLLDEETVSQVWSAFGLYIGRQLRMGRGVQIKNFGTFTFSAPEVILDGVTNPQQRDKQPRLPVFLIAKEFVKGKNLRPGVSSAGTRTIRPYQCQTSGSIQQTVVNFAEIAVYAQQNKDSAKTAVERVLKAVADMARNRENVEVDIPGVGTLLIRHDLASVAFHESLSTQVKGITKRPLSERKQKGDMRLNQTYLQRLTQGNTLQDDNMTTIDEKTKNYLSNTLGIEVDNFADKDSVRPKTAKFPSQSFIRKSNHTHNYERPQTTIGNKSAFLREVNDSNYAIERLRYYVRESSLNLEDAFLDLCNNAFGRTSERKIKMSRDDFQRAIRKIDLPLNEVQTNLLFNQLDHNTDGYIDKLDWIKSFPTEQSHVNYIKDVVFKYKLHTDDLLQRMNLNREFPPLTLQQLADALQSLDFSLNQIRAQKVAKDILGNKDRISIQDLVNIFDTVEEDDKFYDASWFKDTLHRLRNNLYGSNKMEKLKEAFEYFDEHQEGNLDTANFKTVIMESNVGLSVQDINRLVRYIPKIRGSLINYYNFLKMIEDVNKRAEQNDTAKDLNDFALKLAKFMRQKKFSIPYFLQIVRTNSSIVIPEQIACYLQSNVFVNLNYEQCLNFCREIDLDYDGLISEEDLTNFLKKYQYFDARKNNNELGSIARSVIQNPDINGDTFQLVEKSVINSKSIDLLSIGHKKMFQTLVNGMKEQQIKTLHPTQPLNEDKFDRILKDIRNQLALKGLGYEDFFNLLDSDHNGFITISEFSENVDKVLNLSQPAKDGFFAFMDKQQIGLIDLNTFLRYIGKSIVQKMPEVTEDNWNWELQILFKIRNWCKRENLTVEDAFRTFDKDFDGEISKGDIRLFITDILKIESKEITEAKLNRIFKLMDQFKRGKITLLDFRRFLNEGVFYGQNKHIFGDPFSKGLESQSAKVQADIRSSFDWKANARQQIGLVISRHFPSVKQSYDIISGYRKKLVFQKFKKWIDDLNVLAGFDLTEKLLYEIFSDIDSHKKGFLTESDWTNAFGHFHWMDSMIKEIQEQCKNFESPTQAVNFFKQNQHVITKESFLVAIGSLFPKRFQDTDVHLLWNKIAKNNQLTPQAFNHIFGDRSETYQDNNDQNEYIPQNEQRHRSNIALLDRIRRFLRNSNINLQDCFKSYDSANSGKITNIEFRQVMRSLNMGLTLQEIDQLCSICSSDNNSFFDWKEFARMLHFRQADHKILDRAGIHLQKINDHIYNYLISPKDAFRQFDKEHRGQLSFDQTRELLETLFRLAREDVPPFAIINDLFEFIDKRRDGVIDLTEWMDAFASFSNPNVVHQNKRPLTAVNNRRTKRHANTTASEKKTINFQVASPRTREFEGLVDDGLLNAQSKFKNFLRRPPTKADMLKYQDNGVWESSKEFDRIITIIGKNRKYLMDIFKALSQNGQTPLSEEVIKYEIDKMLRSQGIQITEEQWPSLIAWSKKNNRIDYRFLLQVFKDRLTGMDSQPKLEIKNEI